MITLSEIVVKTAINYVGIKEIPGNKGWKNSIFEKLMIIIGKWRKGDAWCCDFAHLVWHQAYKEYELSTKIIDKLFSPNSQRTFRNFNNYNKTMISNIPSPGSIGILKYGRVYGHTFIVESIIDELSYKTIEGNFKDMVKRNTRNLKDKRLLGFIKIGLEW